MRHLTDRKWSQRVAAGPRPHRPYKIGQQCSLDRRSDFRKLVEDYYQTDQVIVLSEHAHEDCPYDYVVEPLSSTDKLKVSHWDLWPNSVFVETRVFLPAYLAKPGIMVKLMSNLEVKMIKGDLPNGVLLADGIIIDKNQLVEIMTDPADKRLAESFVRYQ